MNTMEAQNFLTNNNFVPLQQPVTVSNGTMSMTAAPQPFQPLVQPTAVPQQFITQQPTTYPQAPNWQMAPVIQNFVPVVPTVLPMQVPTCYQNVNSATEILLLTPNGLKPVQPEEYCISQNGNAFAAPEGYTFVSKEEYFNNGWNMLPFPTGAPLPTPSPTVSRSPSVEPTVVTAEKTETPQKTNVVKRPHRAKQLKITEKHDSLKKYCVNKGIFAKEDEVLRGEDVLRIHVKTWEGLDLIESVIQEVDDNLDIARIALPFSQKNKFQKKGFICYLKVEYVEDVELVQSIFGKYSEAFKKCDVAMPTNKLPEKVHQPVLIPFDMTPPTMAKRSSAA